MPMRALSSFGLIRPLVVTLALLVAYAAYEGWLSYTGAKKLTASEVPTGRPKAHYEIVVNFAPEAFHLTRVQAVGRVIEVRTTSIFVMDVSAADARELARNYWVADIKPWKGL
jgi:hypothetical protein